MFLYPYPFWLKRLRDGEIEVATASGLPPLARGRRGAPSGGSRRRRGRTAAAAAGASACAARCWSRGGRHFGKSGETTPHKKAAPLHL